MTRAARGTLPPELESLVAEALDAARLDLPARAEVEADLRAHFEDGLAAGVPSGEMRRRFGDPRAAGREIARARRSGDPGRNENDGRWWMSGNEWWTEVKRSVRRLARAPGFAAVVVATLALGVGANTAIFSVVNAVLLAPLPYPDADRLVRVREAASDNPDNQNYLRGPTVAAYRTWSEVFDGFGALYVYRETGADLTDGDQPARVTATPVSAGYFEALGVAPALGRTFREEESVAPGTPPAGADKGVPISPVAVLSHGLWMDRYGGASDVVGRTIRLDGRPFEIVGVMPEGFAEPFGPRADLWTPQDLRMGGSNNWGNFYLSAVARLKPGLTLEGAQERVDALYARLVEEHPEAGTQWVPTLVPLRDDLVGSTRRTMLLILSVAAGLVLLTACVNLANLLVARGLGRDRDVAVRVALGSGRGRIVAGLLVETGLLALVGCAAGALLGAAGVRALLALSPDALPALTPPETGWAAFAFALAVTLVALVLSGLTPALRLSRTPPADALRSDGRATTGGRRVRRIRDGLAIVQVAAALMLVTGAALLGRSFAELARVPLAIEPEGVLTFEVNLPASRYPDGAARDAFHRTFRERVEALPEVEAVGAVSWLPVNGRFNIWGMYWDPSFDTPEPDRSNRDGWRSTDIRVFSGDYLGALDIRVLRGVEPSEADMSGEPVVWVSARLAAEVFGEADPVGKQVYVANEIRRIAGVVEDVPYDAEGGIAPKTYVPHAQFADDRNWALTQTVKARGDLAAVRERIRATLAGIDGQLVLHRPKPLEEVVASARAQSRFATVLMAAFALLALALSMVGTYGVLAGAVAGRTREFGIRMALGADRASVRAMILRYAAALILPGVVLGLVGAWIGGRWVQALLFEVYPRDPLVYLAAVAVFVAVGVLAGWAPARRATRVDPARTLSSE
ncbi:MAG: ABC transporter permease [Longimicrobiales bacterium]